MVVVNAIAVSRLTPALGKWRKQEEGDRAVAELVGIFGFIPNDDQGTPFFVLRGLENERHILLKPGISPKRIVSRFRGIAGRNPLVTVMAHVGHDEVVARHGMVG